MIAPLGVLLLSASVWAAPSPAEMEGKTCTEFGCHADLQVKAVIHDPVAKGMCNPCHTQSRPGVHEFQPGYPKETLCLACHILTVKNYVHKPVEDGRCIDCHDPKDANLQKAHQDQPFAGANCIQCHDPHQSRSPKLLQAFTHNPFENKMCESYHKPAAGGKVVLAAARIHPAGREAACYLMCRRQAEGTA